MEFISFADFFSLSFLLSFNLKLKNVVLKISDRLVLKFMWNWVASYTIDSIWWNMDGKILIEEGRIWECLKLVP